MLNLLVFQKRFATEKGPQYHIIYVAFQETQHGKLSRQAPFDEASAALIWSGVCVSERLVIGESDQPCVL
jgi:hypothetical protein